MTSYETQIEEEKKAFTSWVHEDLQHLMNDAFVTLRRDVNNRVEELSADIARASTAQQLCQWPKLKTLGIQFQQSIQERLEPFGQHLAEHYDKRVMSLLTLLDTILEAHESVTLQEQVLTLKVNVKSWRKDLLDYLEHVIAYGAGFMDGRGLMMLVYQIPDGSFDHPGVIRDIMNNSLGFLHTKPIDVAHRWTKELLIEMSSHLTQLEMSVHSEASVTRQQVYMPVEALLSLC